VGFIGNYEEGGDLKEGSQGENQTGGPDITLQGKFKRGGETKIKQTPNQGAGRLRETALPPLRVSVCHAKTYKRGLKQKVCTPMVSASGVLTFGAMGAEIV